MLWHFGNTSVRSALRLRDGLIALRKSGKEGQIRKEEGDQNFRKLLGEYGVVSLEKDDTVSVGRKWRSAMEKMGFINPKLTKEESNHQKEIGVPDYISESGQRLMSVDSVNGWHECFLRALCAYYVKDENGKYRSPFIFTLKILLSLHERQSDSKIDMLEMALIVQCASPGTDTNQIVGSIMDFRNRRNASESRRQFDRAAIREKAAELGRAETTFRDYADTNFRYLKSTGVISSKGKGIALVPEKMTVVRKIVENEVVPISNVARVKNLCLGSPLPTDSIELGGTILNDLVNVLEEKGEEFDISNIDMSSIEEISLARIRVEDRLFELCEIEYANLQKGKVTEISEYIEILLQNSRRTVTKILDDESEISIPGGEAPAYFEWIIWRAFLAVNSLTIPPWKARRFQIDQDFLPVSTAPGRGADVIIELENTVLIVELTLTTSSRQEAAEGEPVRRHVADAVIKYTPSGKNVYGLFIALSIDTNTANTFRLGEWYTDDDTKLSLNIVPITLSEFKMIFDALNDEPSRLLEYLNKFLTDCRNDSAIDAPEWKNRIALHCNQLVDNLKN